MRTKITLECTECKQRNYNLTKDKTIRTEWKQRSIADFAENTHYTRRRNSNPCDVSERMCVI